MPPDRWWEPEEPPPSDRGLFPTRRWWSSLLLWLGWGVMTRNGHLDMPELRLECAGLMAGDFSVPPFHVRAGQAVCLHVPPSWRIWHAILIPILSGRTAHPGLRLHGPVSYLERPMSRRRWWGLLHNPSTGHWLTVEKGLTSTEAAAILGMVDVPADVSIGRIGESERIILALEACLLRPPGLLVFETVEHGPETIQYVFERLASRPPSLALIYLKTRRGADDPCLPGATCLEMARAPAHATIVE